MKNWIGIDPSYESFSSAFPIDAKAYRTEDFPQDEVGFEAFFAQLSPDAKVIVEDTGSFNSQLVLFLFKRGVSVHVASSQQINGFRTMTGSRAKNDALDAIAIARYGEMMAPEAWKPKEDFVVELRQLTATVSLLVKQRTALKNQRFSFRLHPQTPKIILNTINQALEDLKFNIKKLEKSIEQLVKKHLAQPAKLLRSIPGLGERIVPAILAVVPDFSQFETARQLAAYVGLTPTTFRSGKSVRKTSKLSKIGPAYLRSVLYMGACNAIQHNPLCKPVYEKMINNGKNKHKAIMAVAHKLVRIAFAVVKNNQPFDPNFLAKT